MSEFALESSAFDHAQPIPSRHTCDGDDLSPSLTWTNVPDETRSLALIVDDPDAPSGVFTHWVAWGLEPGAGGLGEGEAAPSEGLERAIEGHVLTTAELVATYER